MALTGGDIEVKTEDGVATLALSNGPYTVITWEMRQKMANGSPRSTRTRPSGWW